MKNYAKMKNAISNVACGYFFLYFNFNLSGLSLTPIFVGYMLFLKAIYVLQDEEREIALLDPLGTILALWYLFVWVMSLFGINFEGIWHFADVLINLVELYFHFQLLTNIATIAGKYQPEGSKCDKDILRCRTIQTVLLTVTDITANVYQYLWQEEFLEMICVVLVLINFIVCIYLITVMSKLKKVFDVKRRFC